MCELCCERINGVFQLKRNLPAPACILGRRWPVGDIGLGYVYLPLPIELIGRITVWGMVVLSVVSAVDYFAVFWNKIDQAVRHHHHNVRRTRSRIPSKMSAVRE